MTKQEEIREGMETPQQKILMDVANILFRDKCMDLVPKKNVPLAEEILKYLHSQGVVIKVDRELPFVTSNYTLSAHGVYARINKEALSEQGYEAVEPLIER